MLYAGQAASGQCRYSNRNVLESLGTPRAKISTKPVVFVRLQAWYAAHERGLTQTATSK